MVDRYKKGLRKAITGKMHVVQTFRDKDSATKMAQNLRKSGYKATVSKGGLKEQGYHYNVHANTR
ncbi:MAG: hypothetical protein WC516_08670 [Patescibacteria group bacterium]|jgi:hypothetical protein